uniref:Uncharacterized protein n=2 Tax=Hucho hucho TaxID=62062 RepID=A0A4W5LXC2_9TELE
MSSEPRSQNSHSTKTEMVSRVSMSSSRGLSLGKTDDDPRPSTLPQNHHSTQQVNCSLTHLNLAGNGLMDGRVSTLARCLPVCTSMVSVDLSWNPAVTSVGLHSILSNQRPLAYLNLQGTVGL